MSIAVLDAEDKLVQNICGYHADPLGHVLYSYPWGEKGCILEKEWPDDWQIDLLNHIRDMIASGVSTKEAIQLAVASGHGPGKGNCNSLTIETPAGPRKWGDLKPGDVIFGGNGKPVLVDKIFPLGKKQIYNVTFDDGSVCPVTEEHLWNVRGRQERRKKTDEWRILTTEEIIEIGVKRRNGVTMCKQWEIPIQGPVEFEEREIDLHPYLMGVWLGDGIKGLPSYCKPHKEIMRKIESLGYDVTTRKDGKHQYIHNISQFFKAGVFLCNSPERYIPDDYKYNTIENRKELLNGMLDTDGECGKDGSVVYSSTSKKLIDDIIWLARSLGGKASLHHAVKRAFYYNEHHEKVDCQDCYRATININWNPFTIKHRKVRYIQNTQDRYSKRWIESIEYSHDEEAMCITVDAEDGLYLANDFIVTHNTALVAWIVNWFISTRPHCQIVVTANTKQQLDTKTWREVAKWHNLAIYKHWFKWTATKFYAVTAASTWFAACIPWNEHKSEAFAGTHEKDVLIIFDEASMVPDIIWEVASGAMTTPGAMWFVFGNPTMNTGRFRECFGKFRHRWKTWQIDSRTAKMTNKKEIEKWIDDYGEDSDFVRVRVKGQFPRASMRQLISNEIVEIAIKRDYKPDEYRYAPISIGADIARYGDDQTVFTVRQGVKVLEIRRFRELSTPQVAMHLMLLEDEYRDTGPSISVFIDLGYVGGAALDLLEQAGRNPIGVDFGSTVINKKKYFNKRIEMWGDMKEWLNDVGQIPEDQELQDDLIGPQYGFSGKSQLQLEQKKDMKTRGLSSPDSGDSLALTFAYPQLDTSRPDWYDKYGDESAVAALTAPKSNSITGY